jgi:hypothetical protein
MTDGTSGCGSPARVVIGLVLAVTGCGPAIAPADEPRCFEAIDLFEIDPRAVATSLTVADTTGDAIQELWLARMDGGAREEPTRAVAYVAGPDGVMARFAEIEVPGSLTTFADLDGSGRAELVSAESATETEGGGWYRTPIETTGSAGESRMFENWAPLFERSDWWDLDDDGIADRVRRDTSGGLSVELSSASSGGFSTSPEGSIVRVAEVHETAGWLVALARTQPDNEVWLHLIEALPGQPLRDIVTESSIDSVSWESLHAAKRSDSTVIDVFGSSSTAWSTRVLHRIEIDTATESAVASIVEPSVQSPSYGDFDGDGAHDVAWRDPADGQLRVRFADETGTLGRAQSSDEPVLDIADVLSRSPAAAIDGSASAVLFVERPIAEDRLLMRAIRIDACR